MSMLAEYYDMRRIGRKEGLEEGRKEGRIEGIMNNVRLLMQKMGWSLQETLNVLQISPEDSAIIMKKI